MSVVSARRVGPGDWRAWREVRLEALAESPDVFPAELTRARRYDEGDWRERLDPDSGLWALAVAGEEPIGQVGAWLPFGSIPMLVGLWVRPAWRGRGVGDQLVAEVLEWARQRGHGRIDLWVLEHNEPARRLYERHGFTAVDEYMPWPDGPGAREQLMVWEIGS